MKTCSKCGVEKPLAEFCEKGKGKLRGDCKACQKAYRAAYYQANREKARAQSAAWRRDNLERVRAQRAAWRTANPEKARTRYADYCQTEAGKASRRRRNHARRARKAEAPGSFDWDVVLGIWGEECALCGTRDAKMTVGHAIPLSRGGTNHTWNIRPECRSCNSRKKDRLDCELES